MSLEYLDPKTSKIDQHLLLRDASNRLAVTIAQSEGIWDIIFVVSVLVFMIASYVNIGAQLDTDSIRQIINKPYSMIGGFLIGVFIMPLIAWFVCLYFLPKQILFRVGAFVFACCPAASASTLWTVTLHANKELAVGLQVASFVGSMLTMPALLYYMESMINKEENSEVLNIKVPHVRLVGSWLVLLVALYIGWKFVGHNERAQKFSRKIFRPFILFVLLFIIIYSTALYWHIYQMFDLNILLLSLVIITSTFIITIVSGYLISLDCNKAVAICINSTYKNSGVAFAVLLVTFGGPRTYIAFVPCLMQIVITSLSFWLIYLVLVLINCIRRRNQPAAILVGTDDNTDQPGYRRQRGSDRSSKSDENDEFIAMNVTDSPIVHPYLANSQQGSTPSSSKCGEQTLKIR